MADKRAIVIGTGFGGSVTACRLAQAGFAVTVLERGRDYRQDRLNAGASPFPRDGAGLDGWSWCPEKGWHGLIDFKPISEMQYVQSSGLGGGSLIYANVHLRMPAEGFAQGWPEGYTRETLDPYYDLIAHMLEVAPIPLDRRPPKSRGFVEAAGTLGRAAHTFHPALAVNFGPPEKEAPNRFGVAQEGCRFCGECIVGCRHRAKNTLDLNYLAVAERHGATLRTRCEVKSIEEAHPGYRVRAFNHEIGAMETLTAPYVFVCAGAINSTELLLRCRDEHRSLPRLGAGLGTRYSGNGDYLAFATNTAAALEPWNGPSITTALLVDTRQGGTRSWFLAEEGGYPEFWKAYLRLVDPSLDLLRFLGDPTRLLRTDLEKLLEEHVHKVETLAGDKDPNLGVYLFMGRDQARGRLRLLPETRKLVIEWDLSPNVALYNMQQRIAADLAGAEQGTAALNPFWRLLRLPITVHSLGGCPMGTSPDNGVVDASGEVFNYPGLFVLDGGILPESTGVNPSATIGAVAERNIEAFVRRTINDPTWTAPEAAAARATRPADPLAPVLAASAEGTPLPRTEAVGLTFRDAMRGSIQLAGQQETNRVAFAITVSIPDVDAFLGDAHHVATAAGRLICPPLTPEDGADVSGGSYNLFEEENGPRQVRYLLPFHDRNGEEYVFEGVKNLTGDGPLAFHETTTKLTAVVRKGRRADGPEVGRGTLRTTWAEILLHLAQAQVTGTDDPAVALKARHRFGRFLANTLWETFATRGPMAWLRSAWLRFRIWLRDTFGWRERE